MKVRVNVEMSGTRADGTTWPARGEVVDLPDAEAKDYLASGIVEEVKEQERVAKEQERADRAAAKDAPPPVESAAAETKAVKR